MIIILRLILGLLLGTALTMAAQAQESDAATCGLQTTVNDQCRITWNFARSSKAFYWVQQFDSQSAAWRSLDHEPSGTTSSGSHDMPVEAGNLYRVFGCDDASATVNCVGSTMVWASYILPPEQVHLIPSLVASTGPKGGYVGGVFKNADWLTQVIQYNVYQLINAISRANIVELPDMTPVPDLREAPTTDPMDQVRFNVWAAYLGEQGKPLEMPLLELSPRRPHEHPERHPQ